MVVRVVALQVDHPTLTIQFLQLHLIPFYLESLRSCIPFELNSGELEAKSAAERAALGKMVLLQLEECIDPSYSFSLPASKYSSSIHLEPKLQILPSRQLTFLSMSQQLLDLLSLLLG